MKSIDWAKADWSLQDVVLARELGCSRERVRQVRKQHGKPRPEGHRRRTRGSARLKLAGEATEFMTLPNLAKLAGCNPETARSVLKRLGKGYKRRPHGRSRYEWVRFPGGWRAMSDRDIGAIVGVRNPAIVAQYRKRHGYHRAPARRLRCELAYP